MNWEAFFKVHEGLPRQGPGCRADVEWACEVARVPPKARILDAGCGPGADIAGLLACAPDGHVTAVDTHGAFVEQARFNHGEDPRVTLLVQDMAQTEGSFDFIWSAGALYFLGIEDGLAVLAQKLAPGGKIAFSHLIFTSDRPDPEVRAALGAELPDIGSQSDLRDRVKASGFLIHGSLNLKQRSWDAYYDPMRARLATLRAGGDPSLSETLDATEAEIALHDTYKHQFGYVLFVVSRA